MDKDFVVAIFGTTEGLTMTVFNADLYYDTDNYKNDDIFLIN